MACRFVAKQTDDRKRGVTH